MSRRTHSLLPVSSCLSSYLCQNFPVTISVSGLSKSFDGFQAVADLSFSVNEGDIYGFLGQNGAGKSTTIRMLLGLIRPDRGDILIFGRSLQTDRARILQQIGAIIERPDHYKYLTAFENLSLFCRMSGKKPDKKRLMNFLQLVGLQDRAHSKVITFSQGMKQRLGLAIALIHDPKLLILDEPANGLDPQGIAEMREMIKNLSRQEGKTILLSSHLLAEMELMADSMLIMDRGRKVVEGKVSELLDPRQSIVQLNTTDNAAAAALLAQSAFGSSMDATGTELKFSMHKKDVPALAMTIQEAGIGLLSLQTKNSLEAYFLSLTQSEDHVAAAEN
jgi:ABC-2 type transport system ATP-binding protein